MDTDLVLLSIYNYNGSSVRQTHSENYFTLLIFFLFKKTLNGAWIFFLQVLDLIYSKTV